MDGQVDPGFEAWKAGLSERVAKRRADREASVEHNVVKTAPSVNNFGKVACKGANKDVAPTSAEEPKRDLVSTMDELLSASPATVLPEEHLSLDKLLAAIDSLTVQDEPASEPANPESVLANG